MKELLVGEICAFSKSMRVAISHNMMMLEAPEATAKDVALLFLKK
jgi:hypothetical protein